MIANDETSIKIRPAHEAATIKGNFRDTAAQDTLLDPAPRLRKRRRVLAVAAVLGLALVIAAVFLMRSWLSTTLVVPRERVRIATVTRGHFVRDVEAQGTIVAAVRPTLFAPATGAVTFLVKAGESVRKDQVLGSVDSPSLNNEYAREKSTLESLNVALDRQGIDIRRQQLQNQQTSDLAGVQIQAAERELKRAKQAWELHIIPEHDYQRAVDDLETARLTHEHALANARLQGESLNFEIKTKRLERDRQRLLVENLKRRVDELTLHSPVTGMVGNLAVNQKATVIENAPLLTVVDLSAFEIEFRVPESYAEALGLGMPAEVNYSGKVYAGEVTAISPEVNQSEVAGRVRFAKETPEGLRQNQRVNLRIVMDARDNVLKVERGAFVDAGGQVAYVLAQDGAQRRAIKVGAMSVSEVEILSGLTPDEQIVVSSISEFNNAPSVRFSH